MANGIIISEELNGHPNKQEFSAAAILSNFFQADVFIVPRNSGHTPDFKINGLTWELKSPLGGSRHTMEHQFSRASKQSANLVLDARRSKLTMKKFRNLAVFEFRQSKIIKRLIIIDKQSRVIEIQK